MIGTRKLRRKSHTCVRSWLYPRVSIVTIPTPGRERERRAASTVLAARRSQSRPGVGIVTIETRGYNQDRTHVCEFQRSFLVPIKGES